MTGSLLKETLREFVESMAALSLPEEEFAADEELQAQYEDADEYEADFSDDRLLGEYTVLKTMIGAARAALANNPEE